MRENLKWTNLSRRHISRELIELGTPASKDTVSKLLYHQGFRRRKPQKKRTMTQHADRNEQFENIERLKQEYLDACKPVISMDTKKKELMGDFYREGVVDCMECPVVNDHDFPSYGNGKLIPHGIFDIQKNELHLHLNASSDTSEFACESLELWWNEQGKDDYKGSNEVLVLCDGGGSNSSRSYLFKEDLQALGERTQVKWRIAHYPPGCSKYNPIEHKAFPHVTRACQGVPLDNIECAKHYMEKAETAKGLHTCVRVIEKVYETGRKYAANFKENMRIVFDDILPQWNYTALPEPG